MRFSTLLALVFTLSPQWVGAETNDPQAPQPANQLFVTSDQCMACHNGLTTRRGEDVSIGMDWSASMMANAARDPYWQAAVRREVMDHPSASGAIQNECAACHMPMSRYLAKAAGGLGEVFSLLPVPGTGEAGVLAADGVSCTVCHQIEDVDLGERSSFTGSFAIDAARPLGERLIFGPFDVTAGFSRIMQSASLFRPQKAAHVQTSEICATCHTLYTHAFGPDGEVIGELPEQVPYLEWRHSSYRGVMNCQDCHMPVLEEPQPISSVLGEPREHFSRHVFRGGNFLMPRIFNRYRNELGVTSLPQQLEITALRTAEHLASASAEVSIKSARKSGGSLEVLTLIKNLAGHKLPTAYPSRRAWIRLSVKDRSGAKVFESGAPKPDGSIQGNQNDADASAYEPHYERISHPDEVQIYEAILAGPGGEVTTGLLTAVQYVKDNRLLPDGFEKSTAHEDFSVKGSANGDPDFVGGGDTIVYEVSLGEAEGPFLITAELWYQPIAYRWARNLADYAALETDRFVSYFDSMSEASAVVLARDAVTIE